MSTPVEVQRLQQAIEQFEGRAPQNLPDGVMDRLKEVSRELQSFDPVGDSPGHRDAREAAPGTDGTGEHYSRAAKGPDGPSPGQREAAGAVSSQIAEAAKQIAERMKSGGGGGAPQRDERSP